ncbi:MAG: Crp/Fnr family transcriptional regulator [Inquilinaceae bacterium]
MTITGERQPLICPAGTVLFRPEDACPGFVIVRRGTIRVSLTSANGREIVLYRVRPGEVCLQTFSCLIEGGAYSAEGVAETDLDAEIVTPDAFRAQIATDDAFRESVFKAVAHRFADFEQLVEDVALSGFDARLARALLRLADEEGVVHATHDALAAETGSGRAVVSRQLGEFSRLGLVALARGEVRILNEERFHAMVAH